MSSKASRQGTQVIESLDGRVFVFIKQIFPFPRLVDCATAGLNEGMKLSGEAPSPGFRPCFLEIFEILQKLSPTCQHQNDKSFRCEKEICFDGLTRVRRQKKKPPRGEA